MRGIEDWNNAKFFEHIVISEEIIESSEHFTENIYQLDVNMILNALNINPPEDFIVSLLITNNKDKKILVATYEPVYYGSRSVLPISSGFKSYTLNKNNFIKIKANNNYKIQAILSKAFTFKKWKSDKLLNKQDMTTSSDN